MAENMKKQRYNMFSLSFAHLQQLLEDGPAALRGGAGR